MYKFNLLAKINEIKLKEKKKSHLVTVVGAASIFISVVFVVIIYLISTTIDQKLLETKVKEDDVSRIYDKFIKNDFFPNEDIKKVLGFQLNRVHWTKVFSALEQVSDKNIVMSSLAYAGDNLDLSFEIKSKLEKSDMLIYVEAFKDSLSSKNVFKDLIKPNTQITISSNPELDTDFKAEDGLSLWSFSLAVEFKPLLTSKNSGRVNGSKRKRFN